jgi:hypothetical protein
MVRPMDLRLAELVANTVANVATDLARAPLQSSRLSQRQRIFDAEVLVDLPGRLRFV